MNLHFISGLPRSGSTLLSAILSQNSNLHASITSPLSSIVLTLLREMSGANEGAVFIDDAQREHVISAAVQAFYHKQFSAHKTVIDTNRQWCARMPLVGRLFPKSKVICCVREMSEIYDSFEKLVRKNNLQPSAMFGYNAHGTSYSRFNALNASDGVVGSAWLALREAFFGDFTDRLLLVEYETLASKPKWTLKQIYDFLGIVDFSHDFNNIKADFHEFDARLGTPGLHTVGSKVELNKRPHVLPPDLIGRVREDSFWRNPAANTRRVRII